MPEENEDREKRLATGSGTKNAGTGAADGGGGRRKNYIMCIGIGEYQLDRYSLGEVCINDCNDLMKLLITEYNFEIVRGRYDRKYNRISNEKQILVDNGSEQSKATKDNIEDLFKYLSYHPDFKPQANNNQPAHNLLIFYSGHGITLKDNQGRNTFYWVPYDYESEPENPDPNGLFNVFTFLETTLANIRFHHLVLITDACQSAGTFELSNRIRNSMETAAGSDPENEPSAWGFCSSAENQNSFAKAGERNSFFTNEVLEALNNSNELKWRITALNEELDEKLGKSRQRPFNGRLNIVANNTGVFCFNGTARKQRRIDAFKRWQDLKTHVYNLNYKGLRENVQEIKKSIERIGQSKANRFLFCLSTGPDYGLMVAHKIVSSEKPLTDYRNNRPKPCYLHQRSDVNSNVDEASIVKILSELIGFSKKAKTDLKTPFTGSLQPLDNRDEFNAELLKRLRNAPVAIEFRIVEEKMDPEVSVAFANQLYSLLSNLNLAEEGLKPIYIFILDCNNADYKSLTAGTAGNEVIKYVMPEIEELNAGVFDNWCKELRGYDDARIQSYETLFEKIFDDVRKCSLANGTCPPGKFIKTLCERSDCYNQVLQILNF